MRIPARDCSGGFRAYATPLLRRAAIDRLLSHGYSFQEEVLFRCHQAGARIGETPILFANRRQGDSKVNVGEVVRSLGFIVYLGLRTLFGLEKGSARREVPATGT
jgi:dolichol-phosphate mannosyltransferase